jgi:ABC-type transport system involved in multi-copper enzyme maturation permease subunit
VAIYEQSYQPWSGRYASRAGRIWAMVRLEITLPFQNVWVLVVVLAAFALVMAWLLLLFIAASSAGQSPAASAAINSVTGNWLYREGFYNFPASVGDGNTLSLFSMILMFLSATVGSSLISRDLKYNALLMYFSRSITRADYLAGKFLTLALFLLFVTLVPGLLLFAGSFGIQADKLTAGQRLADLLGIVLHSLVLVVPMSAAVLAFSSLTKRPYLAAILWATLFFSSWIFSGVLYSLLHKEWCLMVSWMNLTVHLGNLCYSQHKNPKWGLTTDWRVPFSILSVITIGSFWIVWRRIRSVEGGE